MGSKGGSAPKAPDYTGAAQATASGNLDATRAATNANRVDQYTPYGSLQYTHNPAEGNPDSGWSSSINLSPTGQALLDQQNQTSLGLGNLQNNATQRVANTQSQPMDLSSVGAVQAAAQKAQTDRLDPMWQQNAEMQRSQLANQGLQPGTQAYDDAMRSFNNSKNDAYSQAIQAGINTMPQTYQLAAAQRNQPLNELNAIRSGSQVENPQFTTPPQQATTSGPNYSQAAAQTYGSNLNNYNASTGNSNAMMGGLFNLGGTALTAAGGAGGFSNLFSDIRLKSNIRFIGKRGRHNWYEYDIFGRHETGVLAQEVLHVEPSAVSLHDSGYLTVNYGAL